LKLHVFSKRSQSAWGIVDVSPLNWQTAVFELAGIERNSTPSMRLNALVRTAKAIYTEFNLVIKPKLINENIEKALIKQKEKEKLQNEKEKEKEHKDYNSLLSNLTNRFSSTSLSRVNSLNISHDNQIKDNTKDNINSTNHNNIVDNEINDPVLSADDLVPIFIYVLCQSFKDLKHPITNRDLLWGLCLPDQLHGEAGYYLTLYESAVEYIVQEPFTSDEGLFAEETTKLHEESFLDNNRSKSAEKRYSELSRNSNNVNNNDNNTLRGRNISKDFISNAKTSVATLLTVGTSGTSTNLDKSKSRFDSGLMKFDSTIE